MQIFTSHFKPYIVRPYTIAVVLAAISNLCLAITREQASEQIRNLPCKGNMTADQIIDQSIRSHSQRDIGWRTFQEDDYFDIERAVLVNKGMELHYRWRVHPDGSVVAENDRTERLCNAG